MVAVLIEIGEGGIEALQTFIIVSAVPVGRFHIPKLSAGPRCARMLAGKR
jgi:glycine betaine transporter